MKKSIFLFFAAILCSVSAWAWDLPSGGYIYCIKPNEWTNIQFMIGHDGHSQGKTMTNIANTNIYYWKTESWGGYGQSAFIDANGWGNEDKKIADRKGWASHSSDVYTKELITSSKTYGLFIPTYKSQHSATLVFSTASSYSAAVNRTQTIKVQLKDGSNWVDATVAPADLTASTYALTSATAAGAKSASLAKESPIVSATVSAAYSAKVTLSCSNIADEYTFIGWFDKDGNEIVTSYTVNDTKTVYARFSKELKHTVTVSYKYGSTDVKTSDSKEVGESTESKITAPTIPGYTFSSWELGDGITQKSTEENAITIITKAGFNESDYTLIANYEEDLSTTWSLAHSIDGFNTNTHLFTKKPGESTGNVAYASIDLEAHKDYKFKVVGGSTWYGNNNSDEQYWIKQTSENWEFYSDAGDCHMKSGLAGTYTFKIDYSGTNLKVSVYFPEIYAIVGTFNEWNENTNKLTFDGNIGTATINLQASATNYEFKVIDNAVHGGIVNKIITKTENNMTISVGGGDNIKLTANANPKGDYIFTYNKSTKKLSVTYPTVYTITVEAENGTVEGAGTYVEGTSITLTAAADDGYTFAGWSNGETTNPYTFEVTEDVTLTANFKLNSYTVTATATEGGTVTGAGTYDHGTSVTLTATPNTGYEFVNWTQEGVEVSADAEYTFTLTNNVDITANFESLTITLTDGDNSAIIATKEGKKVNVQVNRTFKANDGYYTICLPFDLDDASEIGKAYQVTSISNAGAEGFYMVFNEVKELSAGQPYLIEPKDLTNPIFKDVTIVNTTGETVTATGAGINFEMVGVINGGGQTELGQYWVGDNGRFYNGDGTQTTAKLGLRVLFNITNTEGQRVNVRARVVVGENTTTSLDNITNGENTTIKVIENGQLIIIRNGEKFNAQGVRL